MSKVVAIMSMSLDGYVADCNDGVAEVFDWYFASGDVEIHTGGSDPTTFRVSKPSAGVRLFDGLAGTPIVLGNPTVIPGVELLAASHVPRAAPRLRSGRPEQRRRAQADAPAAPQHVK